MDEHIDTSENITSMPEITKNMNKSDGASEKERNSTWSVFKRFSRPLRSVAWVACSWSTCCFELRVNRSISASAFFSKVWNTRLQFALIVIWKAFQYPLFSKQIAKILQIYHSKVCPFPLKQTACMRTHVRKIWSYQITSRPQQRVVFDKSSTFSIIYYIQDKQS